MHNIYDATIVVDTDKDLRKIYNMEAAVAPYLTIYDARFLSDKKKAWALKNEYGAQENPFIELKFNGKFAKAFYKEASEDPIQDLITYLNQMLEPKDLVKDAKSLSFEDFKEAHPEYSEHVYTSLRESQSGYIKVEKISDNDGYLQPNESEEGFTDVFTEGMGCYMYTMNHWYYTSVIKHIDWDKKEFTTMNSVYKFNFKPNKNE